MEELIEKRRMQAMAGPGAAQPGTKMARKLGAPNRGCWLTGQEGGDQQEEPEGQEEETVQPQAGKIGGPLNVLYNLCDSTPLLLLQGLVSTGPSLVTTKGGQDVGQQISDS